MAKRPSEMNVVDRIFHDISLHGINSVIKNKDFYQKYKPIELSQHDVIKNEVAVCVHENIEVILPIRRCLKCQHIEEWKPKQTVL